MLQTYVDRFVYWCYYSKDYAFVHDSKLAIPLLQSLHLIGIMLLLGTTVILNLRLLDIGFRRLPLPVLSEQLWRWTNIGLLLATVSGIMVFMADPTRYAHNQTFLRKMVLFCLALIYQFTVFRKVASQDPLVRSKAQNGMLAALSLCLWFGVAWAGRGIAFF
jgi:hypothetical protein